MKVNVEEKSSVQRLLTVEIPSAEVDQTLDKIYQGLKRQVKIKGFRPGKAPRSIIEKYYGSRAAVEAAESLVSNSYADALKESTLEPVARPDFDFEPPTAGQDFVYKITLDVRPEFDLDEKGYKGLELKEPDLEASDEELGSRLELLRERQAVLAPLEEERPAAAGDVVLVNYQSFLDGEPVEGGAADNVEVELGKGRAPDEIETVLLKSKPGDMLETTVSYDDNAPNPQLKGKDVVFKLLVKEIKTKILPDLDDDFAKAAGPEFESLEALKERMRKDLNQMYQEQKDAALRTQILDQVRELGQFDLPESLVKEEIEGMVESFKNRMRQNNIDPDQTGMDDQKLSEGFTDSAQKKVRSGIVLGRIAEMEKVEVSDEDVEARIAETAERMGQPAGVIKEMYIKNNMMPSLRAQLLEEKTLQAIKANAIIKKVDPAELGPEKPSEPEKETEEKS